MIIIDMTSKLKPTRPYPMRRLKDIKRIVFHHTSSPMSTPPKFFHELHIRERGWRGIGYHYLINRRGTVYKTRPVFTIPTCVKGHNRSSICVAWIGDFRKKPLPPAMIESSIELVRLLRERISPDLEVTHHAALDETDCPGEFGVAAVEVIVDRLRREA